jgi:hypothetical protein
VESLQLTVGPSIPNPEDATRLHRIYESVSKNIERENALISYRISWSIFLSAGILAAETFMASYAKDHYPDDPMVHLLAQGTIALLSCLAAYFCFMSRRGVKVAIIQMEEVKDAYVEHETSLKALGYPRPYGDPHGHRAGDYNAKIFPIALMILWCVFAPLQAGRFAALLFERFPLRAAVSKESQYTKALGEMTSAINALGTKLDDLKLPDKQKNK